MDGDADDEGDAWYWEEVNAEDDGWRCIRCSTVNGADDDPCQGCGLPKAISTLP